MSDDLELSEKAKSVKLGKYKHFKGKEYRVLGVGKHSESLSEFVVYKALYGDGKIWIRPLDSFLSEKYVGINEKVERFTFIEE